MKCIECQCCVKGFYKCKPDVYVCIGVKEPFIIEDVNVECPEYPNKRSGYIKHKYLHELFPNDGIPFPYGEEDYPDFDKRDTYNMNWTLIAWLYERLRCFKDITIISLDFYKFNIDGKELTQGECIDRMIKDCEFMLLSDSWYDEDFDKVNAAKDDLFKVLSKVYWAMWW